MSRREEKSRVIKKILLFLLVGVVSYTSFLIATLPASFVWKYVAPQLPLKPLQIDVKGVSGTAWNGYALIHSRGIEGVLEWDILFSGLLTGSLGVDLELKSNVGNMTTNARLFSNGVELDSTKGNVDLRSLNSLLKKQRVTLSGVFKIDSLTIGYIDGVITVAKGLFSWTGGRVEYPAGRETHGNEFPSFTGVLDQKSDVTMFTIKDVESSINSVEAIMENTGIVTLKVKRRLLDLANEPWPKNSSESDVVFKVRRKVL